MFAVKRQILVLALGLFGGCLMVPGQTRHYLDVWAGGGYDALLHGMDYTKVPGGGGFNAGLGYELNINRFLFQTGAEFQYWGSKTRLVDYSEDYVFRYDDGFSQSDLLYHYNFLDYAEKQRAGYVNIPLLFGMKFDRYYAMIGSKIGLNLFGNYRSETQVHATVTDPTAIEDITRKYDPFPVNREGALALGLNVTASAEVGVVLDEWLPRNMTRLNNRRRSPVSYRAGLFVDYGLPNLNTAATTSALATPRTENGVVSDPLSLDYAHLEMSRLADGHRFSNLYAGVKLTVQFQMNRERRTPSRMTSEPMWFYAHVTDAQTQENVSAEVTARYGSRQAFKKTTDADGMVSHELRRGRYVLSVQADGYKNYRKSVPHYREDTLEIALTRLPKYAVRVLDSVSGSFIPNAGVTLYRTTDDKEMQKGVTDPAGVLSCDALTAGGYRAFVEAEGYLYREQLLTFANTDTIDIMLHPIEKDMKVVLHNLFFELNKADIKPESEPVLNELYQFLVANPDVKIHIVGHTDNTGTRRYNMELSEARAEAVYKAIVERGISADRITFEGKGPDEPVATNDTEEGRAMNRRVEFVIK